MYFFWYSNATSNSLASHGRSKKMNEFHFAEMIQGAVSNGLTSFTIWLTIVSGYMYVAYSAGKELNRLQTAIISSLYVVSSAIFTAMTYTFFVRAAKSIYAKAEPFPSAIFPEANGAVMENAALGLTILMFFGLLASLYFMFNIRRKNY